MLPLVKLGRRLAVTEETAGSKPARRPKIFTAGSSTVEQMSDTHLTEVRLFLGRPSREF